MRWLAVSFVFLGLPAEAACRLALVLALDVSASVDAGEYRLQAEGMAQALTAPEVAGVILGDTGNPVWLSVFVWSGPADQSMIVDWLPLNGPEALYAAAEAIATHPRRVAFDGRTAIGAALNHADFLLSIAPPCDRMVVDLATDGRSNAGPDPQGVSDGDAFADVTINALAIGEGASSAESSLSRYLRLRVTRGPDAFVETARDYADFERAMTRKLLRELQAVMLGAL